MYQNLIEIDWFTIIATLLNFVILYFILRRFLYAPVKKLLDDRKNEVSSAFGKAEAERSRAEELRGEYEHRLNGAYDEAKAITEQAVHEAQQEAEGILEDAKARAADRIVRAEERIEAERRQTLAEARGEVAELALTAAEQVLREHIDREENEKLVVNFLQSLEGSEAESWQ